MRQKISRKRVARSLNDFTPEELAEKRARAIAVEAERKLKKIEENRLKHEQKLVDLGRAICGLSLEKLGITPELQKKGRSRKRRGILNGDEVVTNVARFVSNVKRLLGDAATKGTVWANTKAFAGVLCAVNPKTVYFSEERIERFKRMQALKARKLMEEARREREERDRIDELFVSLGRSLCSLTPEDVAVLTTSSPSTSFEITSPGRLRPREKRVDGEDVLRNTFYFVSGVQTMLGEPANETCFRSAARLTSILCNVAEKTVRDRQKRSFPHKPTNIWLTT